MTKYAKHWLKRLLGLTPWARMHRKAFLQGFEEGLNAAMQVNGIVRAAYIDPDFARGPEITNRTIN